jgi:hypothetical protein
MIGFGRLCWCWSGEAFSTGALWGGTALFHMHSSLLGFLKDSRESQHCERPLHLFGIPLHFSVAPVSRRRFLTIRQCNNGRDNITSILFGHNFLQRFVTRCSGLDLNCPFRCSCFDVLRGALQFILQPSLGTIRVDLVGPQHMFYLFYISKLLSGLPGGTQFPYAWCAFKRTARKVTTK